ncbi:hypothetical protein H5410_042279 [Solanum commersonii]|uniref:Uncharacterized protein n=1 Tax=Solanum commersonii TaxID=4109 RepID=A0A9J5XVA7_SOLCO|nr:hypothetical protein H5410_042279 [Solanum commersonii]
MPNLAYLEVIETFNLLLEILLKDVDLCVHFAINDAKVEGFTHVFHNYEDSQEYNIRIQEFGFKQMPVSVTWSNLISLSLEDLKLTNGSIKKIVLAGCPNLGSIVWKLTM